MGDRFTVRCCNNDSAFYFFCCLYIELDSSEDVCCIAVRLEAYGQQREQGIIYDRSLQSQH